MQPQLPICLTPTSSSDRWEGAVQTVEGSSERLLTPGELFFPPPPPTLDPIQAPTPFPDSVGTAVVAQFVADTH